MNDTPFYHIELTHFYLIQLKTPADLRHTLETTFSRDMSQPYNSEEHYDSDWVTLVMSKMYTFHLLFPFSSYVETYFGLDSRYLNTLTNHYCRNPTGKDGLIVISGLLLSIIVFRVSREL